MLDLSQHVTDRAIADALGKALAEKFTTNLDDIAMVEASYISRALDMRVGDVPGILPRYNIAAEGKEPKWRYKISDLRQFLDQRKHQPRIRI